MQRNMQAKTGDMEQDTGGTLVTGERRVENTVSQGNPSWWTHLTLNAKIHGKADFIFSTSGHQKSIN